ncbi:MAG: aromatic ring-hydroxylating dioxygenase subunit alpha, partial [Acidimicrobiia bacterium]|nr:aromatic ring-hydroxylating dioxygenase subunit alpha [Acidimicrobiia bacterium]
SQLGLTPVAQLDTYHGLVFATLDAGAPGLAEYLGDMAWYLDILLDRYEGGTELIGSVQKWPVRANWKFPAENFISDFQHAQTMTHVSAMKAQGFYAVQPATDGVQMSTGGGHGLFIIRRDQIQAPLPSPVVDPVVLDWLRSAREASKRRLGELRGSGVLDVVSGTVFPNFSFLMQVIFPSLRVWQPRGPEEIEIWSWCIVPRSAPAEVKDWMRLSYQRNFGPGGMFEQDDAETWQHATAVNRGFATRQGWLSVGMGLGHEERDEQMPGLKGRLISESNARTFLRRWKDLIAAESWSEVPVRLQPLDRV